MADCLSLKNPERLKQKKKSTRTVKRVAVQTLPSACEVHEIWCTIHRARMCDSIYWETLGKWKPWSTGLNLFKNVFILLYNMCMHMSVILWVVVCTGISFTNKLERLCLFKLREISIVFIVPLWDKEPCACYNTELDYCSFGARANVQLVKTAYKYKKKDLAHFYSSTLTLFKLHQMQGVVISDCLTQSL